MNELCDRCRGGKHCLNAGTVSIMDQDGLSRYVCGCSCAAQVRRDRDVNREIDSLIVRHGAERIQARLDLLPQPQERRGR